MDKLTCVRKVWTDVWHPQRCGKPAKFYKEGIHGQIPLCGIHARSESRRGVIVHALPDSASACPYGQKDCESTRGGVCVCAMPETGGAKP